MSAKTETLKVPLRSLWLLVFACSGVALAQISPADNGKSWNKECACANGLTQTEMAQAVKHLSMGSYDQIAHVNVNGSAVVELSVRSDGYVKCARAVSGHPLAMNQLISSTGDWIFKPVTKNGTPMPFCGQLRVNFKIVESRSSVELAKPKGN